MDLTCKLCKNYRTLKGYTDGRGWCAGNDGEFLEQVNALDIASTCFEAKNCKNCKKLEAELKQLRQSMQPRPRTEEDIRRQIEQFEELE